MENKMGTLSAPRIRAQSFASQNAKAIPRTGRDPEAIWHVAYDTKLFTSAATVALSFFDNTNIGNRFLTNMEVGGQFPAPQVYDLHGVYCDLWAAVAGVSTSASNVGNANDIMLLLYVGTPVWTFTLQQKKYGPYPLITLHGLGGPSVFFASAIATPGSLQFARNVVDPGWGYNGSITIPAQTSFQFTVEWAAAQTLTANWNLRISFSGKLSRAVK
jgi:hypothetical protein